MPTNAAHYSKSPGENESQAHYYFTVSSLSFYYQVLIFQNEIPFYFLSFCMEFIFIEFFNL